MNPYVAMIGVIYNIKGNITGFRLIHKKNLQLMDATRESVLHQISNGFLIENLVAPNQQPRPSKGKFSDYSSIYDQSLRRNKVVVLFKSVADLYVVVDGNGKVYDMHHNELLRHHQYETVPNIRIINNRIDDASFAPDTRLNAQNNSASLANVANMVRGETYTITDAMEFIVRDKSIERLRVPKGVVKLGEKCFEGCDNLIAIELPDTLTEMGSACFAHCHKLEIVIFSGRLSVIPFKCFYNCTSLTSVRFPHGVQTIGRFAFYECNNLKEVFMSRVHIVNMDGAYLNRNKIRFY